MAIIISDTSPIRALNHLKMLSLVGQLYGELIIPPAVELELRTPARSFPAIDVASSGVAVVRPVSAAFIAGVQKYQLDPGETEALALALELKADLLLIDEAAGRKVAALLGIQHVGVIGVLMEAKRRGVLPRVAPLTARLRRELRFHIHPDFEKKLLATIGEAPEA
ncbi:MAG: DUF3368 domain-containing protein [Phycisphaerae bacterium]